MQIKSSKATPLFPQVDALDVVLLCTGRTQVPGSLLVLLRIK